MKKKKCVTLFLFVSSVESNYQQLFHGFVLFLLTVNKVHRCDHQNMEITKFFGCQLQAPTRGVVQDFP